MAIGGTFPTADLGHVCKAFHFCEIGRSWVILDTGLGGITEGEHQLKKEGSIASIHTGLGKAKHL